MVYEEVSMRLVLVNSISYDAPKFSCLALLVEATFDIVFL